MRNRIVPPPPSNQHASGCVLKQNRVAVTISAQHSRDTPHAARRCTTPWRPCVTPQAQGSLPLRVGRADAAVARAAAAVLQLPQPLRRQGRAAPLPPHLRSASRVVVPRRPCHRPRLLLQHDHRPAAVGAAAGGLLRRLGAALRPAREGQAPHRAPPLRPHRRSQLGGRILRLERRTERRGRRRATRQPRVVWPRGGRVVAGDAEALRRRVAAAVARGAAAQALALGRRRARALPRRLSRLLERRRPQRRRDGPRRRSRGGAATKPVRRALREPAQRRARSRRGDAHLRARRRLGPGGGGAATGVRRPRAAARRVAERLGRPDPRAGPPADGQAALGLLHPLLAQHLPHRQPDLLGLVGRHVPPRAHDGRPLRRD
mmetsp:Transcript_20157/g.59551  ORF Transcript_20157/g.59551 Transcript_20157/m.59551 type:complete len:375 (-) Transcript_20157:2706-3830(-)